MKPLWADGSGLPTRHAIRAALRVARLIDPGGSPVVNARDTYWHVASGGTLPPPDLAIGEELLVDLGLIVVHDGVLVRTPILDFYADGDDETAAASIFIASLDLLAGTALLERESDLESWVCDRVRGEQQQQDVLGAIIAKFDATHRALVGDIGEEHVMVEARQELTNAGHDRLARAVRRVSLVSDAYGYDIAAPRVYGPDRLLEVKATTSVTDERVTVFISRNEADVAAGSDNWALVICHVQDIGRRSAETLGWLRYPDIARQLPLDTPTGRWESASLTIPLNTAVSGMPSAFL